MLKSRPNTKLITNGKKYTTSTNTANRIVDKKKLMNDIRLKTAASLKKNSVNDKRHFICLTHTYPAWKNFFNIARTKSIQQTVTENIKDLKNSLQKQSHSAHNPYGHTLADFFILENESISCDFVMNVATLGPNGIDKKDFIHFIPSEVYYFNNSEENKTLWGNQQGGIFERSYLSLAYEVDEETWHQMQRYYANIKWRSSSKKNVKFTMGIHMITNKIRNASIYFLKILDANTPENKNPLIIGLYGILYKVLINLIFGKSDYFLENKNKDYSIVFYEGQKHDQIPNGSFMYPFYWIRNSYNMVWSPEKMANIIIKPQKLNELEYSMTISEIPKEKARQNIISSIDYVKKILKME